MISAADQRNENASTRITVCWFATASSNPASAGPAKNPTLSIVLDATFAAVSSAGSRASDGSSAADAGRNAVPSTTTAVASAYTASAGPLVATNRATTHANAARTRSAPNITYLR